MAQQTKVNGDRYSFTSLQFSLDQLIVGGVPQLINLVSPKGVMQGINYDATQDPGIVQGNQIAPVGTTSGYGVGNGDFEMLVSELDDFFDVITLGGSVPIMSARWSCSVSYSVNDVDVRVDTLLGCKITGITSANSQGTNATTKQCKLYIPVIYLNGKLAFGDPTSL